MGSVNTPNFKILAEEKMKQKVPSRYLKPGIGNETNKNNTITRWQVNYGNINEARLYW